MQLLTEMEMAARLSVTPRTLRNWRSKRLVPFIKVRKVILFDPAKVLAALEKFERGSAVR
jgi:DNA-binding transcriptional MerR regulator